MDIWSGVQRSFMLTISIIKIKLLLIFGLAVALTTASLNAAVLMAATLF